jgi:hypothetical protein
MDNLSFLLIIYFCLEVAIPLIVWDSDIITIFWFTKWAISLFSKRVKKDADD